MSGDESSNWATRRFGEQAGAIRDLVSKSFLQAVANAQDAQEVSGSKKRFTFGSTLMTLRYERLVENFRDLPEVQIVKPKAAPYELVLVGENLLFPFRYAKDNTTPIEDARIGESRLSGLVESLFNQFGPKPSYVQDPIWDTPEDTGPEPVLTHLPEGTRLILIAHAANDKAGPIQLYWGEAVVVDAFGRLKWIDKELIQLTRPDGRLRSVATPELESTERFDHGTLPDLTITPRPEIERKNEAVFPVNSEADEETASAEDHEQ
ncbi:hypothetical protein [Herbidospora cretacea]|uniref:hypothetical protein n=1 Tax=Herbidospora cretacea TaxID=28444 RepID=UPI000773E752|nr:hypothetical protein [Herbidospora cretacea]